MVRKIFAWVISVMAMVSLFWIQNRISVAEWRDPLQIKVELLDSMGKRSKEILIADPAIRSRILDLLNKGSVHPDHDCAPVGYVTLVWVDKEIQLPFLPGHDKEFFEYRYAGRNCQIDRAPWLSLMVGLGLPEQALCNEAPAP